MTRWERTVQPTLQVDRPDQMASGLSTLPTPLSPGNYKAVAKQKDAGGSGSDEVTFTVDTSPPAGRLELSSQRQLDD